MRGWIRGRCRNCLTTAQSEGRLLLALERRCLASDRMVAATRVCKLKNIITVCYNGSQSFSNCLANARNSNERRRKRISTFSFSLLRLSWVEHWLDRKGLFSSILILVFPLFQTRASSRSRIDLTVSESRVSLWNCAYICIYGSAHSTLFLGRKKKGKKRKRNGKKYRGNELLRYPPREEGGEKFPSAPSLLRLRIALTDWTERERGNFIRLRNDRDVTPPPTAPRLEGFLHFYFIYYLETAARFMQTRKLDRVPGKIVSDRK